MNSVGELHQALGADLLRARLMGRGRPIIGRRYVVDRILGRGASGVVVAALDDRLQRPVALKLRPGEHDAAALEEARALARLDHRNVVRVHDVDVVTVSLDGRDFRVWVVSMERVEGRTLRSWWQERARTTSEIVAMFLHVARGLEAAHAANIVHRDVKPDNVIVTTDGVARLVDFGFAVHAATSMPSRGGVLVPMGTDAYIAPEARRGAMTRKSDQYSFGVSLVEALSGEPRPAGRGRPPGVRRTLWSAVRRMTNPSPGKRFPDMTSVAAALEDAMQPRSRSLRMVRVALVLSGLAGVAYALVTSRPTLDERARSTGVSGRSGGVADGGVVSRVAQAERRSEGSAMEPSLDPTEAGDAGTDGNDSLAHARPDAMQGGAAGSAGDRTTAGTPICALRSGAYSFESVCQQGSCPAVRRGCYVLGVDARRRRPVELSLRRVWPRRDTLEVVSSSRPAPCTLELVARATHRTYEFVLHVAGHDVTGTFRTRGDLVYGGAVVPATGCPPRP